MKKKMVQLHKQQLIVLVIMVLGHLSQICESERTVCETPTIEHGTVKSKRILRRVSCDRGYRLFGPPFIECVRGKWAGDRPICAKDSCAVNDLNVANGKISKNGAALTLTCDEGFELNGNRYIFCDGRLWDRPFGSCKPTSPTTPLSCDFESNMICGWFSPILYDNGWKRVMPLNVMRTFRTGPSHDHTISKRTDGHYMLVESFNTLREPVYFSSPTYSKSLTSETLSCFEFHYFMFGAGVGSLYAFIKPVSVSYVQLWRHKEQYQKFVMKGNQNNSWHKAIFKLDEQTENFAIVFGAAGGTNHLSDIAIDDVKLMTGDDCRPHFVDINETSESWSTTTEQDIYDVESCSNRCGSNSGKGIIFVKNRKQEICSCHAECLLEDTCCPDYTSVCNADEIFDTTISVPRHSQVKWVSDAEYDGFSSEDDDKKTANTTTPRAFTERTTTSTKVPETTVPSTKSFDLNNTTTKVYSRPTTTTISTTTTTMVTTTKSTTPIPTSSTKTTPTTTTASVSTPSSSRSTTTAKPSSTTTRKSTTPWKPAVVNRRTTTTSTTTSTTTTTTTARSTTQSSTTTTTKDPPYMDSTTSSTTNSDVSLTSLHHVETEGVWVVSQFQPKKTSPLSHGYQILFHLLILCLLGITITAIWIRHKEKILGLFEFQKKEEFNTNGYMGSSRSILTIFKRKDRTNENEPTGAKSNGNSTSRRKSNKLECEKSYLISDDESEWDSNAVVLEVQNFD